MSLMVEDIEYLIVTPGKSFRMVYHVNCENFHKTAIEGKEYSFEPNGAERRVIQYLSEQHAKKF